jgi:single-strand DNA-binding protein
MIIAFSGRIGKDAEVRTTQGGETVTGFSVGCNAGKDRTVWVDCSIWGERGEKLAPYLRKGTPVGINGRPAVRAYSKNGEAVGVQQCIVNHVDLLGSKSDGERSDSRQDSGYGGGSARMSNGAGVEDDEIPFAPEWR